MRMLDKLSRLPGDKSIALDLMRFYLGVGLFVRGALFVGKPEILLNYMERSRHWFIPLAIAHYVVMAHLFGGLMLAVGLRTRLAALAQVPPLIGAVIYVHFAEGLLSAGQSLEFATLVLFLLLVLTAFGAGKFSLDYLLDESPAEANEKRASLRALRLPDL